MDNEKWQVSVGGQIYETTFAEMTEWIAESALLPTDAVRKNNLRWVKADQVPALRKYFAGEAVPIREPETVAASTASNVQISPNVSPIAEFPIADLNINSANDDFHETKSAASNVCRFHEDAPVEFVCKNCCSLFCRECPKSFGTVRLCPLCGEMCETKASVVAKQNRSERQILSRTPFGFEDFSKAIAFPFQFVGSLFLGALFYAAFLFGGLFGNLLANMLLFGCITQIIGQVAHGKRDCNFMPDFHNFDVWDDVLHPWFLGFGVALVSWLPAATLIFILIFGMLGSLSNDKNYTSLITPDTATTENFGDENATPKTEFKARSVDEMLVEENSAVEPQNDSAQSARPAAPLNEEANEIDELLNGSSARKSAETANNIENMIRRSDANKIETQKSEQAAAFEMLPTFLSVSAPLVILFLISVLWGIFYSPIALAIAGYTRSFLATVNPLVGIDTIRRMGVTYVAAFFFVLAAQIANFLLLGIVAVVTSPFELPFFGNLPAKFTGGVLAFYFSLVIAFVLGSALFKTADKLAIKID